MNDEFLYLWAQWGALTTTQLKLALSYFGSFEAAWRKIDADFLMNLGMRKQKVQRILEIQKKLSFAHLERQLKQLDVTIIYYDDEDYPLLLKEVSTAPPFLFVRGTLPSLHKSISVVGTRNMSHYGSSATQKLTKDLVKEGFVIVSGLALGVDTTAHQTTLKEGGVTVAVLGSGVDHIYPASNYRLAQQIIQKGGAVISTYPIGTPALSHHFPKRNEVVAGMSKGTLVIEGGIKSGALITAKLALDYGREVFAIPAPITHLALSGTNHLIRKGEAKLVDNSHHILEEFSMKPHDIKQNQDFSKDEKKILERLAIEGKSMDQLMDETEFDIPKLSELLIHLNLKEAVMQTGEKWILN